MLAHKHARFLDEYLIHNDAKKAALAVGYSKSTAALTGHRILARPEVKAELAKRTAKLSEESGISAKIILERLNRIAQTAENNLDLSSAIKANELIGKHLKLFTDKVDHSVQGQLQVQIVSEFPDE